MTRLSNHAVLTAILLGITTSSTLAGGQFEAVRLVYHEIETGIDPYTVEYTVSKDHVRIDDTSDSSGYIVFDIEGRQVYSVSHHNKSILVIPEYPAPAEKPAFGIDIEYKALDGAPKIAGKTVYNYRVRAGTGTETDASSAICMDIQLVPGLMPDAAKSLQAFQIHMAGRNAASLDNTPEEYRTPCFLIGQIHNQGDYYARGLPIQEWHSSGKSRQLVDFENTTVDASVFDIPADYRQFSIESKN